MLNSKPSFAPTISSDYSRKIKDSLSAALGITNRRIMRNDMSWWARVALAPAGQIPAAHHTLLIRALEKVSAGAIDRLMVLMPPGSAKSTYGSVLFPAWWFTVHPDSSIIAAAHTASLAHEFGRRVRGLIDEHPDELGYYLADQKARHAFRTNQGGSYFATGVHGAVTGRRADLVLIDDPVKSHAEADSLIHRDHLWNWYRSDLLTRLRPGGRVVLIMTRWHEDDLGGRLLESGEGWTCLRLPALAEAGDELGRPLGAALWPAWEDAVKLERKRAMMGEREFAALFQQHPRPMGETLFKASRIETVDTPTGIEQSVRAWDLAATGAENGRDPDWTVGLKLVRDGQGRFVVLDVVRLRGSPHVVERTIVETAMLDGRATIVALPQDPGQAGRAQVGYLTSQLAGFHVVSSPETGAKLTRAMPVASQIEAGNLLLARALWNRVLLDELREFPLGRKDDQVDALSRAFSVLSHRTSNARSIAAPSLAR